MKDTARLARNSARLATCYPPFAQKVAAVIADVEKQTNERTGKLFRIRIQEAHRTPAEQMEKFRLKLSKVRYSFHNVTAKDGRPASLAVDLVDDDFPLDPSKDLALILASAARAHGLMTGVLWGLTAAETRLVNEAVAEKAWKVLGDSGIEIGWDSYHVQPGGGFSIAQARAGARPIWV